MQSWEPDRVTIENKLTNLHNISILLCNSIFKLNYQSLINIKILSFKEFVNTVSYRLGKILLIGRELCFLYRNNARI